MKYQALEQNVKRFKKAQIGVWSEGRYQLYSDFDTDDLWILMDLVTLKFHLDGWEHREQFNFIDYQERIKDDRIEYYRDLDNRVSFEFEQERTENLEDFPFFVIEGEELYPITIAEYKKYYSKG